MFYKKLSLVLCVLAFVVSLSACGKKESDEPTKYRSQAGLEKLSREAAKHQGQSVKKDNLAFNSLRDIQGKAAEVRDLDALIRPVLKKLFGDTRLVSESGAPETKRDGEVIENKFTYIVSKSLIPKDGESLHAALLNAGFSTSPRLGSKPTIWSGGATMSLFESTSMRTYSLVINVDTRKQQIVVESYRLGSKYDRLM